MKRIFLDTSILIDYIDDRAGADTSANFVEHLDDWIA